MNGSKKYYRVKDNSMSGDRIIKDDLVVIDMELNNKKNDIVLVKVDSQVMLRRISTNGNGYVLCPSNPEYKEIVCDDILIIGVIKKILAFY